MTVPFKVAVDDCARTEDIFGVKPMTQKTNMENVKNLTGRYSKMLIEILLNYVVVVN